MTEARSSIPWRRRMDVVVRARQEQGTGGYVVKDPIALRYYQLGDEEHFVWSRLDGRQTVSGLCAAFAEAFLPRQLSADELQRFVGKLIAQGLVIGDQARTAAQIDQRVQRQRWQQILSQCFNVLAIRFRGVNPDRFLTQLLPWCAWLFSPWFLFGVMGLWLSAIGLWWQHADEFLARWPEEIAQWTMQDLGSLMAVLAAVKIVHELAHGLTCKRFGGAVPELGVMLLVFTPCLYCNVTDAWLLRSKWQRIAISAAGMLAEVTLAAVALWLWWGSIPGPFHSLCLQVVLLCGVSTLVFNLNPLMRYDGYFMLADWLEQPNLHQQATAALGRRVGAALSGQPVPRSFGTTWHREWGLAAFALTAMIYRFFVVVALLWAIHHWLEPQGYGVIANLFIALTIFGFAAAGVTTVMAGVRKWSGQSSRDRFTIGLRVAGVAALFAAVIFVPLPSRVIAPVILEPAEARTVSLSDTGQLVRIVAAGNAVTAGDPIAEFRHPQREREGIRFTMEAARAKDRVAMIERRQVIDPQAGLQRRAAEQTWNDLQHRLEQFEKERERLAPKSSIAGVFWPAAERTVDRRRQQLSGWSGSLDDVRNQEAWVTAGTTIGMVGPADRFEAIALLPQSTVMDLQVGQPARLTVEASPDGFCIGRLQDLAVSQTPTIDPTVATRLRLPTVASHHGARLVGTWYRARIEMLAGDLPPVRGLSGTVAIQVPPQSLWTRGLRWIQATFLALRTDFASRSTSF